MNKDLSQRLLSIIQRGAGASLSDEEFTEIALAVFAHQYELNPTYRAYCDRRGASPASVVEWIDIPVVPTDAFKAAALVCGDPSRAEAVFRTSGTTRGTAARGTHYLLDTRLYREALANGFAHHLLPDDERPPIFSLIAASDEARDSSLSFMMTEVIRRFGGPGSGYYLVGGDLLLNELLEALDAAGRSVLIAGTSLAFVHLLDAMAERGIAISLPSGSRAMDTGGFKGRARQVGREELYGGIEGRLGIAPDWVVNEYGMTEMSSQFYDGVAGRAGPATGRVYQAPGWVRTVAVDPETLRPLPDGSTGVLRHLDLANLDSVLALQTADLGRVTPAGLELHGRAPGAAVRGCSVAMDELREAIGG